MEQFTYEEQGTYTWLVRRIEESEELDSLSMGMMTKNRIPGIIPIVYNQEDTTGYIKYNVSSRIKAREFLTGMVNRERILGVFSGIANAMTWAENYMLDPGSLLLDLDYIFVDAARVDVYMICLPFRVKEQRHLDLAAFFRDILFHIKYDPSENFDYVTQIVNYLNSTPLFSLGEFKKLVDRLHSGGGNFHSETRQEESLFRDLSSKNPQPVSQPVPSKPSVCGEPAPDRNRRNENLKGFDFQIPGITNESEPSESKEGDKKKKPGLFARNRPSGKEKQEDKKHTKEKANKKKTGKKDKKTVSGLVIPAPGGSVSGISMTDDEEPGSYNPTDDEVDIPGGMSLSLQYITEGRWITVSGFPFEIGREGRGLKIDMSRTKVSRQHAVLTQAGGQFLITDFSKHGTFLNGERIPKGEPRILENGMRILLKTEEFEVRISNGGH